MHLILLPVLLTFAAALTLAAYVAFRRQKTIFHWLLIGLMASIAIWTSGTLLRFSVSTEAGLQIALGLIFGGILLTAPLWLLVCARNAQVSALLRPGPVALLWLPAGLLYLALLTNDCLLYTSDAADE